MFEEVKDIKDWQIVRIKRAKGGYAKIHAYKKSVSLRYKDDDGSHRLCISRIGSSSRTPAGL